MIPGPQKGGFPSLNYQPYLINIAHPDLWFIHGINAVPQTERGMDQALTLNVEH